MMVVYFMKAIMLYTYISRPSVSTWTAILAVPIERGPGPVRGLLARLPRPNSCKQLRLSIYVALDVTSGHDHGRTYPLSLLKERENLQTILCSPSR